MRNMLYNCEIVASTKTNIGSVTTLFSGAVDVSDCDGVLFTAAGGTQFMPETSAIMHVQCSTALAGTYVNYGSTVAVHKSTGAMGGKPLVVALDCYKPTKPYIRAALHHTSGNFAFTILKYGMRRQGSTSYRDDTRVGLGFVVTS